MDIKYTPYNHSLSFSGDPTDAEVSQYKTLFESNNIKAKADLASYYEKKGVVIGWGCPNVWADGGGEDLAKEYIKAQCMLSYLNGGGTGGGSSSSVTPGGAEGGGGGGGTGGGGSSGGGSSSGEGSSSEGSSSSSEGGDSSSANADASPGLSLSPALTNLFDVKQHCTDVNSSVLSELLQRESVQKMLQAERDAEKVASEAEALATDSAFVTDVAESVGDLMTAASTIPAVNEQDPGQVQADNALDSAGTAEAAENSAQDKSTESTENAAEQAAEVKKHGGNCGGRKANNPATQEKVLENAKADNTKAAVNAVETGQVPDATTKTDAQKAADQLVQSDTGKDSGLAQAGKIASSFGEAMAINVQNGSLTPYAVVANFDTHMDALGAVVADATGASQADVPPPPCASQEMTDQSGAGACLLSTINKFADKAAVGLDTMTSLLDQAMGLYEYGPEILIDCATKTIQTFGNIAAMTLKNALKAKCTPVVNADGSDAINADPIGGIRHLAVSAVGAAGSVNHAVNVVEHTDDIKAKGKRLLKSNPFVRDMGTMITASTSNTKNYDKLTTTGIKFARNVCGTTRQNQLTSSMKTVKNHTNQCKTGVCSGTAFQVASALNTGLKMTAPDGSKKLYTTSSKSNKYNCYGLMTYAL